MYSKRLWILAMVILLIFNVATAYAAKPYEIAPCFVYTKKVTASLSISSGIATCQGTAQAISSDNRASLTVKLQRLENGSWITIATWTNSAQNGAQASVVETKGISTGYEYRVLSEAKILDKNGKTLETATATSPIKNYTNSEVTLE